MTPLRVLGAVVLGAVVLGAAQASTTPLAIPVRSASSQGHPVWVGYRVPIVPGDRRLCFDGMRSPRSDPDDLRPAGPAATELVVMARADRGDVSRVRVFTPDCAVDAGGTPIVWLNGISGSDSAAWLASIVERSADEPSSHVAEPALMALALHADPSALRRLIALARDDARTRMRGRALFWLAERAGDEAMSAISGAVDNDPDLEVRKRAVFALSQLPKDEGVPKLIEVARTNRSPAVRRQAMFWLGQSNDARAVKFFEEILARR